MNAKKNNRSPRKKADGSMLPFPPMPSASTVGSTLQESTHKRRVEKSHLPEDAPNILIVLLDDVGFGLPDTYGGPIRTPALTRVANEGISYNRFHTTSICSPTRAALLTGRKRTQYFDNNGNRGIYHNGWYACTFGPLTPWLTVSPGAGDLGFEQRRVGALRPEDGLFTGRRSGRKVPEAIGTDESAVPQGSKREQSVSHRRGHLAAHSSGRPSEVALHELAVRRNDTRMPEFTAPGLGRESNRVVIDVEVGADASGVLYALGGASGG